MKSKLFAATAITAVLAFAVLLVSFARNDSHTEIATLVASPQDNASADTYTIKRPIRETQSVEIAYTVRRPVRETRTTTVSYAVMTVVREKHTNIDPATGEKRSYTVARLVPERREQTVNYVLTKMVPERKHKRVEYQTVRFETTRVP